MIGKLINFRKGFATNSSSTHSIVLLDHKPESNMVYNDYEFGWDFFTATGQYKDQYIALMIHPVLSKKVGFFKSYKFLENYLNIQWKYVGYMNQREPAGYVDHQSIEDMYITYNRFGEVDLEFLGEVVEYLRSPNIAILGGNDNTDEIHPWLKKGTKIKIPFGSHTISRKNSDGSWTLFNSTKGDKARILLDVNKEPKHYQDSKLDVPELVDIKITNFCESGCEYCYQNSTKNGTHASMEFIEEIAFELGKRGVFEAAIGGGEPTTHPHFLKILELFRNYGIIPNFSTRSLTWLNESAEDILKTVGAVSYSVTVKSGIEALMHALKEHELECHKHSFNIQYVMGTSSISEFKDLVKEIAKHRLGIILLGYKDKGRGEKFRPDNYEKWFSVIKEIGNETWLGSVGVDTLLINQSKDYFKDIPYWMYHKKEGRSSMYVDAVDRTCGESSYTDKYYPIDHETLSVGDAVLDIYQNKIGTESDKSS